MLISNLISNHVEIEYFVFTYRLIKLCGNAIFQRFLWLNGDVLRSSASTRMKTVIRITQKKNPDYIRIDPDFESGSDNPDRNRKPDWIYK
jgi:hypothetical protein